MTSVQEVTLISPQPFVQSWYCTKALAADGTTLYGHIATDSEGGPVQAFEYTGSKLELGPQLSPLDSRSLTCGHGYLVTGGSKTTLFALETQYTETTLESASVSNGAAIGYCGEKNPESLVIVVAFQSATLVFFRPDGEMICTVEMPTPMNQVSISPDGSFLAAVGDKKTIFLAKLNPPKKPRASHPWQAGNDFGQKEDSIFAKAWQVEANIERTYEFLGGCHVAWSPDSEFVGVAMNSGLMVVINKAAQIVGECATPRAGRLIEFSPLFPTVPLIIFGNSTAGLTFIDASCWGVARFWEPKEGTKNLALAGLVFDPTNPTCVLAATSHGLYKVHSGIYPIWCPLTHYMFPESFVKVATFGWWLCGNDLPHELFFLLISVLSEIFYKIPISDGVEREFDCRELPLAPRRQVPIK